MATKSDKNKMIALTGLGLLLIGVLVYQLFFSSPRPKPTLGNSNRSTSPAAKGSTPVQSAESAERLAGRNGRGNAQDAEFEERVSDITPLAFVSVRHSGSAVVGPRGNIFEFYKVPPTPPPPPMPPPPIALQGVSPQSATAGTPRAFTLTVYGRNFPADSEVTFDGRAKATKRVNDGALSIELAPADYSYSKTIQIEVKSKSEPLKYYSNPTSFVVSPTPEPQFRFIGIIGDQAVLEVNSTKEVTRVRVGDKYQGVWRVDTIGVSGLELTQLQFDIKRRVPLQEKAK